MKLCERLYSWLLTVYPRAFLVEYRQPMEQAFRDQLHEATTPAALARLWLYTMRDLALSAISVRRTQGSLRGGLTAATAYLFAAAAVWFIGKFELHTDDEGVVVGFILVSTFVLGWLHPRRAWLWMCLGLCIPAADHLWATPARPAMALSGTLLLACFVLSIGSVGSWSAFLLRRAVRRA